MKKLKLLLIFVLFFGSLELKAQQVVSDPALLALTQATHSEDLLRWTESIKQITEQLKTLKNHLEEAKLISSAVGALRKDVSTAYNNLAALPASIKKLQTEILSIPESLEKFSESVKNAPDCFYDDLDEYQKADAWVTAHYGSPTQVQQNPCGHLNEDYASLIKRQEEEVAFWQHSMKNIIASSQVFFDASKEVDDLVVTAENSVSQKEVSVINSKLLGNIAKLLASLAKSQQDTLKHIADIRLKNKNDAVKLEKKKTLIEKGKAAYQEAGLSEDDYNQDSPKLYQKKADDFIEDKQKEIQKLRNE